MSDVTNVIILTDLEENGMPMLNLMLEALDLPVLREISEEAGGRKALESDLWAAAYNHLDPDVIPRLMYGVNWENIDGVTLLIKGQQSIRYQVIPQSDWDV